MAVAVYTTDLTLITEAENLTGWSALGGGGAGLSASPDLSTQGINCVDKSVTNAEKGAVYNGAGVTLGAGDHILVRIFVATPGLVDLLVNRGVCIVIGSATSAYNSFHVEGSDTYGAVARTGKSYPINYVTTANASEPYRTLTGVPGASPSYFGATISTIATVKGANLGVDVMRYGTGMFVTAGDIATPANFSSAATLDNAVANRWGLLTFLGGSSYELQGKLVIGQNNAGTPTPAYFQDQNKTITLIDTPHTTTDFTQIIIDDAATEFYLDSITIEAAGTNNRGKLIFNNATTTSTLLSCAFAKIDTTSLNVGVSAQSCTWRATNQITLNGGNLESCVITNNGDTASVVTTDLALIKWCNFTSLGTGHAVELTSLGSGTMTWDSVDDAYATIDGSTGNETIFVNVASGTLTINVAAGSSTPTIRSAGAVVTVIAGQTTLNLTGLVANSEVRIYTAGTATELDGIEDSGMSFPFIYTYVPLTFFDIIIHKADYKYYRIDNFELGAGNASLPIQQLFDRNYSNP